MGEVYLQNLAGQRLWQPTSQRFLDRSPETGQYPHPAGSNLMSARVIRLERKRLHFGAGGAHRKLHGGPHCLNNR